MFGLGWQETAVVLVLSALALVPILAGVAVIAGVVERRRHGRARRRRA